MTSPLTIDNFAGFGGASCGIERALGRPVDHAINHSRSAIYAHQMNHPGTTHHCEDVFAIDPRKVAGRRAVGLAWFSPDCTHHSIARGGKPRDKSIRALAWITVRWAYSVRPRVMMLENVKEFRTWGPLDENGRIIEAGRGSIFRAFIACLSTGLSADDPAWGEIREAIPEVPPAALRRGLGYSVEYRVLRACDYGAPTTRERFFMVMRCDGEPIRWPAPTHAEPGSGRLIPWPTAADCINWTLPCYSIFLTREEVRAMRLRIKRPLAEKTMARIGRGTWRYVIEEANPFIVPFFDGYPITNRSDLVSAFLAPRYGEREGQAPRCRSMNLSLPTVVPTGNGASLVASHLVKLRGTCADGQPVTYPMPTITGGGNHIGEVRAFLIKYYGQGCGAHLREPMHTVTSKDRMGLVLVGGATYAIADIGLRMLVPRELARAQGFPDSFMLVGSQDEQVEQIGNSVPPAFAEALVRANYQEPRIVRPRRRAAAQGV